MKEADWLNENPPKQGTFIVIKKWTYYWMIVLAFIAGSAVGFALCALLVSWSTT